MALEEGDPEDSRLIYFYDKDADRIELDIPRLQAQGWIKIYQDLSTSCSTPGGIMSSVSTTPAGKMLFIPRCLLGPAPSTGRACTGGDCPSTPPCWSTRGRASSGRTGRDRKVHLQPPRAPSLAGLL